MRTIIFILTAISAILTATAAHPLQTPDCGNIDRLYLYSPQLADTMTIDIWTPDSYAASADSLPVIYMHDGQNLFDASTTWNHQAWEVDSVMCALLDAGIISPAIVVGIHTESDTRIATLMPQKAVDSQSLKDAMRHSGHLDCIPRGDAYVAFLAETLKPVIDSRYRTLPDRANTSVMGSSMGGLMSIYTLCERPDLFGNALCLSTHWTGEPQIADLFAGALYDYIDRTLPSAARFAESGYVPMLYFDHGTTTIDALYGPYQQRVTALLRDKGYDHAHLMTYIADGRFHEENSWRDRLYLPLTFLLHR